MTKLKLVAEPGRHNLVMWRDFSAPRERVFRALTDPTLIPRWWGPKDTTTFVDKMEVRKGGIWRYIQRDADGGENGFNGVYHDITSPERMIYTFEWEGLPGHVLLETITLTEQNGVTTITDASIFQSVEDRDGMIQSGMEGGAAETWDRFEEVLKTM